MTRQELIAYVRASDPVLAKESDEALDAAIRLLYPVAVALVRHVVASKPHRHESRHLRPRVVG
jgi:hypothetical protein